MKLTRNFALAELTATATGLPNNPNTAEIDNLRRLAQLILQPIRDALDQPVVVTSGYRSPAVNRAVGGSATSDHARGLAADIKTAGMNSKSLARYVLDLCLPFDQLIVYPGTARIHISYRPNPRRQVLTSTGGGYRPGLPG